MRLRSGTRDEHPHPARSHKPRADTQRFHAIPPRHLTGGETALPAGLPLAVIGTEIGFDIARRWWRTGRGRLDPPRQRSPVGYRHHGDDRRGYGPYRERLAMFRRAATRQQDREERRTGENDGCEAPVRIGHGAIDAGSSARRKRRAMAWCPGVRTLGSPDDHPTDPPPAHRPAAALSLVVSSALAGCGREPPEPRRRPMRARRASRSRACLRSATGVTVRR